MIERERGGASHPLTHHALDGAAPDGGEDALPLRLLQRPPQLDLDGEAQRDVRTLVDDDFRHLGRYSLQRPSLRVGVNLHT